MAKSFALREAPSNVTGAGVKASKSKGKPFKAALAAQKSAAGKPKRKTAGGAGDDYDVGDAERRMEQVVRAQGRLTKKSGKIVSSRPGSSHGL